MSPQVRFCMEWPRSKASKSVPECGRWHLTSHGAPYPVIPGPQSIARTHTRVVQVVKRSARLSCPGAWHCTVDPNRALALGFRVAHVTSLVSWRGLLGPVVPPVHLRAGVHACPVRMCARRPKQQPTREGSLGTPVSPRATWPSRDGGRGTVQCGARCAPPRSSYAERVNTRTS